MLNAVVIKYPTILNTAILAKHWGTKYIEVFNGDDSLEEWKRFLLAASALFEEYSFPANHLKVLKAIRGEFTNLPEYKAIVALAEAQVDVIDNKDQCEVFPALKKRIEGIPESGVLGQALIKEIDEYLKHCDKTALGEPAGRILDLLMGISSAHAANTLEPRWVGGDPIDASKIKREMDKDIDLSESGGELELTCENPSEKVNIKTCHQYYERLEKGCFAVSTYDMTMQSWFIHFCDPRKSLLGVKSSKTSFVRDLLNLPVDRILERLDLTEYLPIAGDESDVFKIAKQKGLDWTDLFYDFEIKKTEDGGVEIESNSQDVLLHFNFVALGDINADGFEDLNINTTFHLLTGSFRWYTNTWFTLKSAGGMLEKIRE